MSQVNLSSFSNAAATAARESRSIVLSGDGQARASSGPHFKSTHQAAMDAFIDAVTAEYGAAGRTVAEIILKPLYEQGLPLEARKVLQVVDAARSSAVVGLDSQKDGQGRSALDRAVDTMPHAKGLNPEQKGEIKSYVKNALVGKRCDAFNSMEQLQDRLGKEKVPGLDVMLHIVSNKAHPVNKILAASSAPADQARARDYLSKLLSMAAAPDMSKAGVNVDENALACVLARAVPGLMRGVSAPKDLTPDKVWQALFHEGLPQALRDADKDSLADALCEKIFRPVGDMARASVAGDARLNEGAVENSLHTLLQGFSLEQIAQAKGEAGLHLPGPSSLFLPGSGDAERSLDDRFDRALMELGARGSGCGAGVSLVVGDGDAARAWQVDTKGGLGATGQAARSVADERGEVLDALAELRGPSGPRPSDTQAHALITCLGQNGSNLLIRMLNGLGLPAKNEDFAYSARITPGENGEIKVRMSIDNIRDQADTLRACMTMTIDKDGAVSIGDLHATGLPEERLALNSARAEQTKLVRDGLSALAAGPEAERGPALLGLLQNTLKSVNGSMEAFSDIVNSVVKDFKDEQTGPLKALLGSQVMGEAVSLLLESTATERRAAAEAAKGTTQSRIMPSLPLGDVQPEVRAAYAQIVEDRRQTVENVANIFPCLNVLAGALGGSLAQPVEGASWYKASASEAARAAAGAIMRDPVLVQRENVGVLAQVETTNTFFRGNTLPLMDINHHPREAMLNAGLDFVRDFTRECAQRVDEYFTNAGIPEKDRAYARTEARQEASRYMMEGKEGPLNQLAAIYVDALHTLMDRLSAAPGVQEAFTQAVAPMLQSARRGLIEARDYMAGGVGAEIRAADPNAPDVRMCNLTANLFLRSISVVLSFQGTDAENKQGKELAAVLQGILNNAITAGGGPIETTARLNVLLPGFSELVAPINKAEWQGQAGAPPSLAFSEERWRAMGVADPGPDDPAAPIRAALANAGIRGASAQELAQGLRRVSADPAVRDALRQLDNSPVHNFLSLSHADSRSGAAVALENLQRIFTEAQAAGQDGTAVLREALREAAVSSAPAALPGMSNPDNALLAMLYGVSRQDCASPFKDLIHSMNSSPAPAWAGFVRETLLPLLRGAMSEALLSRPGEEQRAERAAIIARNVTEALSDSPSVTRLSLGAQRQALNLYQGVFCLRADAPVGVNEAVGAFIPTLKEIIRSECQSYIREQTPQGASANAPNSPAWTLFDTFNADVPRNSIYMDGRACGSNTGTTPEDMVGLFPNRRAAALISIMANQTLGAIIMSPIYQAGNKNPLLSYFGDKTFANAEIIGRQTHRTEIQTMDAGAGKYRIVTYLRQGGAPSSAESSPGGAFSYEMSMDVTLSDPPTVSNVNFDMLALGPEIQG